MILRKLILLRVSSEFIVQTISEKKRIFLECRFGILSQMNTGKYVFSQVMSLLDPNDFIRCVKKYNGNYKVKHFTCWHQLMCLIFGQLSHRESLSDLITCLNTQRNQWYHLGLGTGLSKNNLAHANEYRDWRIFADYAYLLIAEARKVCTDTSDFEIKVDGNVY